MIFERPIPTVYFVKREQTFVLVHRDQPSSLQESTQKYRMRRIEQITGKVVSEPDVAFTPGHPILEHPPRPSEVGGR